MARSKKRLTKPKISSKSKRRKVNTKLDYGQVNRNVNTIRKIIKANHDEKNIENE